MTLFDRQSLLNRPHNSSHLSVLENSRTDLPRAYRENICAQELKSEQSLTRKTPAPLAYTVFMHYIHTFAIGPISVVSVAR